MRQSTITKLIKLLEDIKNSGESISEYCSSMGLSRNYVYVTMSNIRKELSKEDELFKRVEVLYNSIKYRSGEASCFKEESVLEEDFKESDELSGVTIMRSSSKFLPNDPDKGIIVEYVVNVKVRDSRDFVARLSREDVETIFGLYTYYGGNITARNVANEFPRFTLSDIKKIFRAFKLTKDSAWFPPHLAEELNEEELAQYRMNIKERAAFKYADSRQERDFKNVINKMATEINELRNTREYFNSLMKDFYENPEIEFRSKDIPKARDVSVQTLILFLSDMHIGAKVESGSMYENNYDMEEVIDRIYTIVSYLSDLGTFDTIVVVNVGDALDGMDNQTSRRDHFIPQNMDNKEQIKGYITAVRLLFKEMMKHEIADTYSFMSVPCGNHGGTAEWAASNILAAQLKIEYPDIEVEVSDSFFLRYDIGEFTYFICHGKDDKFMSKGLPLNLDPKNEVLLTQYVNSQPNLNKNINIVSGDLHNESVSRGKVFKYWKVGSFFGSSDYCMFGFGNTPPHVNYHIIQGGDTLLSGTIELK